MVKPAEPPETPNNDDKTFRTVKDCKELHGDSRKRVWWLAGIVVGLSALMLAAIERGWSATNRADRVDQRIERVEQTIDTQGSYLEKTLTEIKTDVREIRANQQRALQVGPNK